MRQVTRLPRRFQPDGARAPARPVAHTPPPTRGVGTARSPRRAADARASGVQGAKDAGRAA
eukprot:3298648-Prymnesium_polylepis.1